MIFKLKTIIKDLEVRSTFIVTVGILIGTVFSYLLQIGLGHLLSIEDFGTFNTLLSLSIISGIPAAAVSVALIKKVSELLAEEDFFTLRKLFWSFIKASLAVGVILATLFMIFKQPVSSYLNIYEQKILLAFAVYILVSFLNVAPQSYLQGLLRFKAFSFFSASAQFIRFLIPFAFAYIGFSIAGVYLGLTFVVIITFFMSLMLLKKNYVVGKIPRRYRNVDLSNLYSKLLTFSGPVLLINTGMAVLNNLDVIMVKHFFTAYDAGVYAGIVTMGKILLFGAGVVQIPMFPQISHYYALKKPYIRLFVKYLALQLTLLLVGLFVYFAFPSLITSVLFSGKFISSATYLPFFSVFIALYVLMAFLSLFLLAINKTKAYMFILPLCLAQYILINNFHSTIYSIIRVNILTCAVACFFISAYVIKSVREGINNNTRLQPGKNHQI